MPYNNNRALLTLNVNLLILESKKNSLVTAITRQNQKMDFLKVLYLIIGIFEQKINIQKLT